MGSQTAILRNLFYFLEYKLCCENMACGCASELVRHDRCVVRHYPAVLPEAEATEAFHTLKQLPWRRETDDFGLQSRETLYVGDPGCDFAYVGLRLRPRRWPAIVSRLRSRVAAALDCDEALLSGCLLNNYPSGNGCIPWHWDEVRAHGEARIVATLSFGGPRVFRMRRRGSHDELVEVELAAGSVLVMMGETQAQYYPRASCLMGSADPCSGGCRKSTSMSSLCDRPIPTASLSRSAQLYLASRCIGELSIAALRPTMGHF